jgi:uncharacterized phage-associated protein
VIVIITISIIYLHPQNTPRNRLKMNKIEASKYIAVKLCDWYYEINPEKKENNKNDISILKLLKLIFLLAPLEFEGKTLLDYDFKFEAWTLGPVEVDLYSSKADLYIDLKNRKALYSDLLSHISLEEEHKTFINGIVEMLRNENKNLINLTATQLVDLTHKFSSWIKNYKSNSAMEKSLIIKEEKYYFI